MLRRCPAPRARLAAIVFATGLATSMNAAAQTVLQGTAPDRLFAQASTAPSAERIRAQAQRMKEYRELLNDRDANVRLAALDEMLKSNDAALRELAYDAAFSGADQNLRAIALRSKILGMKSMVIELDNTANLPDEQWKQLVGQFNGPRHVVNLDKADPQTGNLTGNGLPGRVSGQEFTLQINNGALRLRLGDGAVMTGHMTYYGKTAPARVTLQ